MALLGGTRGFALGFAAGFGSGLLARSFIENPREKLEPVMKVAMKAGVRLAERAREVTAHVGEMLQDTFAEVRHDLKKMSRQKQGKHKPKAARRTSAAEGNVIDLKQSRRV